MAEPETIETPKAPVIERLGVAYLKRLAARTDPPEPEDEVYILNPAERKELSRIEKWAVIRAGLAGAISASISALSAVYFWDRLGEDPLDPSWQELWSFWSVVGAITLVATILEILFLYADAIRSVHKLAHAAGLDMFPDGKEDVEVARVMVRAALELPNPPDAHYGVDPRAEVSKARLILSTLAYKAKVTVTNFLVKAIVRKVFGRAGARAAMEFVAVPVFAIWNGLICWWVVREARIRAMGPSAAEELVRLLFPDPDGLNDHTRNMAFRAISASIVRSVDLHPNLVAMFESAYRHLGEPSAQDLDDSDKFLEGLKDLSPEEQDLILRTLETASFIDGRLAGREKRIILKAKEICGKPASLKRAKAMKKAFVKGAPLTQKLVLSED